jgi:hypothetical protein
MENPTGPSVEPSEPEVKQQLVDACIDRLDTPGVPTIIGIGVVRDTLLEVGLDVNEDGFIIDVETGEMVEPYAYSPDKFREIESPVEDPLAEYFYPESETELLINPKEQIHLSELHSVYPIDGAARPIRDDSMALTKCLVDTGVSFSSVCKWSNALQIVTENSKQVLTISIDGENLVNLNCLDCGFRGLHTEWVRDDEDNLRCPDCNCLWKTLGIEICTACQKKHRWEDITADSDETTSYWEPSCPNCDAGLNFLHKQTRSSEFTNRETSDTDYDSEIKYLNEIKNFDRR